MNYQKELGEQNRKSFIVDVKRLLDIELNYEYNKYLDSNPYRIYIEIKLEFMHSLSQFCKRRGYEIEYHIHNWAWVTFDKVKMIKWYRDFNSNYEYNMYHFYKDEENGETDEKLLGM